MNIDQEHMCDKVRLLFESFLAIVTNKRTFPSVVPKMND